jgi:hypothetical protein
MLAYLTLTLLAYTFSQRCNIDLSMLQKPLGEHFNLEFLFCSRKFSNCIYDNAGSPNIGLELSFTDINPKIIDISLYNRVIGVFTRYSETGEPQCISNEDALAVSVLTLLEYYGKLTHEYNNDSKKCRRCIRDFNDIPFDIRTAVFSYYYDHKGFDEGTLTMVRENNWGSMTMRPTKESDMISKHLSCGGASNLLVYLPLNFTNVTFIGKDELLQIVLDSNAVFRQTMEIENRFPYSFFYTNNSALKVSMIRKNIMMTEDNYRKIHNETPEMVFYNETFVDKKYQVTITAVGKSGLKVISDRKTEAINSVYSQLASICLDMIPVLENSWHSRNRYLGIIDDFGHLAVWAIILLVIGPLVFFTLCCFTVCKWCFGTSHHHHYAPPLLFDQGGSNFNL